MTLYDVGQVELLDKNNKPGPKIWLIRPNVKLKDLVPQPKALPVAPGARNTIVVPDHAIVDIELLLPAHHARDTLKLDANAYTGKFPAINALSTAPVDEAPLLINNRFIDKPFDIKDPPVITVRLAINLTGKPFEGSLNFTVRHKENKKSVIRVPIKTSRGEILENLAICAGLTEKFGQHAWMDFKVTNADDNSAVTGATIKLSLLRDNNRVTKFNRVYSLRTDSEGLLSRNGPSMLAVPAGIPLIIRAESPKFYERAHMLELTDAQAKNFPEKPHVPQELRLSPKRGKPLAGKKVMLDPGHGIVYASTGNRRVQEWYVAARLADEVANNLMALGIAKKDIIWTRTSGLGLIEPRSVNIASAPELGAKEYDFDLENKKIRIIRNRTLKQLSELLLQKHQHPVTDSIDLSEPAHDALLMDTAGRESFIQSNKTAFESMAKRQTPPGRIVKQGSVRWSETRGDYIFSHQSSNGGAPVDVALKANASDKFDVTVDMLKNLAERSALWAIRCSISQDASLSQNTEFRDEARKVVLAHANKTAFEYMVNRIMDEAMRPPGDPFLTNGLQGWGPNTRRNFINSQKCDLVLTFHENATSPDYGPAHGVLMLVSQPKQSAVHIRLAKTFLKYTTGLDTGTLGGGIAQATDKVALLNSAHCKNLDRHVYFELEFFNAQSPLKPKPPPSHSTLKDLLDPNFQFLTRNGKDIALAALEWLTAPQEKQDFDQARIGRKLPGTGTPLW